uniref:Uncharacterized protein n=1 Tax=Anguilla anguilla TaxID=7936 RepID=A0A0E9S3W6_ANGAN
MVNIISDASVYCAICKDMVLTCKSSRSTANAVMIWTEVIQGFGLYRVTYYCDVHHLKENFKNVNEKVYEMYDVITD